MESQELKEEGRFSSGQVVVQEEVGMSHVGDVEGLPTRLGRPDADAPTHSNVEDPSRTCRGVGTSIPVVGRGPVGTTFVWFDFTLQ